MHSGANSRVWYLFCTLVGVFTLFAYCFCVYCKVTFCYCVLFCFCVYCKVTYIAHILASTFHVKYWIHDFNRIFFFHTDLSLGGVLEPVSAAYGWDRVHFGWDRALIQYLGVWYLAQGYIGSSPATSPPSVFCARSCYCHFFFFFFPLQPRNIFLHGQDCYVRIGDFGLACRDIIMERRKNTTSSSSGNAASKSLLIFMVQ